MGGLPKRKAFVFVADDMQQTLNRLLKGDEFGRSNYYEIFNILSRLLGHSTLLP